MRKIALVWTGIALMCAAGCGAPEPTATGEIERESIGADLDVDQWPWDADRVEVECWGSGAEQAHIYTIVVDGRRYGASVSFRDGTFRVPEQGAFGYAAELPGVELDERLGGLIHRAAREVCGAWGCPVRC